MTTHILSLATLFPDATRPNFGIFVERSITALAAQPDVAVTVVAPVGIPMWPLSRHPRYRTLAALPDFEARDGYGIHRPRFRLIPGQARRNAAAIAKAVLPIARQMRAAGKLDVIDAQFFWPDGPAAQRIATALDLPFSIKARGSDISLWAGRADTGPLVLAAAQGAAGLLAVAATLKDDMAALGMPADAIRVHYTGLDAQRFCVMDQAAARRDWGMPVDGKMLVSVGALIPRKGQALAIAALAQLPPATHLWIAGDGPDRAKLTALAQQLGVAARVQLLGAVPNDRLPSLYAAADAMVLPSASEGLANAWVEALGCGTPLVLADIPPAHEIIDAPDAGRIATAQPTAMAAAIRDLLASPVDRAALSARTHARFNWQRNGRELAEHLCAIAARHGGAGR